MGCHEIHRLWSDLGGGHDEITFVLTILVIGDDDQPPGAEFGDDFLHG